MSWFKRKRRGVIVGTFYLNSTWRTYDLVIQVKEIRRVSTYSQLQLIAVNHNRYDLVQNLIRMYPTSEIQWIAYAVQYL